MESIRDNAGKAARALRELPTPDSDALAHSQRSTALIRSRIAAEGGLLSFARFMELALYAPGLGYYSAGSRKLGASGDFVTAPEISPLFSRCLARQCRQVLEEVGGEVLEFGAGTGAMAADLLAELEALACLPEHYFILEVSADLRDRQRARLADSVPRLLDRVVWLDALPPSFHGVVLANEVLDAMPVQRFRWSRDRACEMGVADSADGFVWREMDPDERLADRCQELAVELGPFAEGYESEVNLAAEDWILELGTMLEQGAVFLIDYGFPRAEYYHPQRQEGTLMCHYRHRAHSDPLILLGLQDITAHVDFTAIAEAALATGLQVRGFANQASFLLANGLLDLAAGAEDDPRRQLELGNQVKKLTLPSEMGELFKVMALTRGLDVPLQGFLLRDDRVRL